jgi:uncharacterized membrane protein
MNWFHWALLSALFAGLTAVLAKAGVKGIDSNLATAIRTVVILVFVWSIALPRTREQSMNKFSDHMKTPTSPEEYDLLVLGSGALPWNSASDTS